MEPWQAIEIIAGFCGLLALGAIAIDLILDSPEARDARKRNHRNRAGDSWR